MSIRNYKITIGLLLVTIVICLVVVSILCVEVNLLREQASETTDLIQTLESKIELLQNETDKAYLEDKRIKGEREYLVGQNVLMVMLNLNRILTFLLLLVLI